MTVQNSERVLILAPSGRDTELLGQVLAEAGIASEACANVETLTELIEAGSAAAIVADEALTRGNIELLAGTIGKQPEWSDFPLVLMMGSGELTAAGHTRLEMFEPLGNVTLVERPLRTPTLLSTVATALRSRRHQYQIRERFERERQYSTVLRENEERLKFALDAANLGSWEVTLPERTLTASDQCKKNFGLSPEDAFDYARLFQLIHPEDRERVQNEVDESIRHKKVFQAEYKIVRPNGTSGWIFSTGRPLYTGEGKPSRMVGVTLDITERRKGEEAIRESETQLRALADSIPQLAWIADEKGYLFWYNRQWYDYTGTTLDEMRGWGWQSVHDPEILPIVLEHWGKSIATDEPFEMEFPLRGADSVFRWFLTRVRPVRNAQDQIVRWFGTNTDIDDKRHAERALRESEELARSVIQSSPDCVEVLSPEGLTLLVNAEGCRLLGDIADRKSGSLWAESWRDEDRISARNALKMALSGNQARFQGSSRSSADGKKWWDVIVSPIIGADGKPSKLLCVSRDITARRQAEEQMRQTAKLESLGVMAGGIAHDFNNLLTSILGNASLLVDNVGAKERSLAEDIVLAAERAADLTKQMLAYSGKGRFELVHFDLSSRVREMMRLVKPSMDKNVDVVLNLSAAPCMLEGDPSQIQQVIMNVVINAGEAMEGRHGRVLISTGRVSVDHTYIAQTFTPDEIPPGDYVYLEVHDDGKGMDEQTRAKIFDPFFTTKFTGRGLGLAAVSGIVRGHKGAMRVYSVPGQGTTFKVLFPAAASESAPAVEPKQDLRFRGSGLILLVDDEDIVRRIGEKALTRHGYRVCLAKNGAEALELFRELYREIDVVVLDMTMPVMNGEETLRRMREISSEARVIVCSGYNEVEVIRRFTTQKIAAFLQKPYTASKLAEKVRQVLKQQPSVNESAQA